MPNNQGIMVIFNFSPPLLLENIIFVDTVSKNCLPAKTILRPRLVQRIFTEKVKETETEERNGRRSFGTDETTTPFPLEYCS